MSENLHPSSVATTSSIEPVASAGKINRYTLLGSLAIMLAALFWSIDGLFIRPQFYVLPADLVVFWEHLLGLVVLVPFIFISWPKIKSLSLKSWGSIVWVSVFGGAIGTIMITQAFFDAVGGQTTFATVVLMQKLQPIFALLLASLVLREKLPKKFYFWTVVAIVASFFMAFAKTGLNIFQIDWFHNAAVLAFLAAFAFGSSTVFGKRIANHLDYKAVAALRFALTAIIMLGLTLADGNFFKVNLISHTQWGLLVLIVCTSGAASMFIYYFGLRRVSASASTILELFWPFSALVMDYVFNHNYLSWGQALAAAVLLFAFYKVSALDKLKPVTFSAPVIHGQGRGKLLGYQTANLDKTDLDIPHGVYVVKVNVAGKEYSGVMHFGFRDVFNEPVSLEVLIKDFSGDLYGQFLQVTVLRKIREVQNFASTDLLKQAIAHDLGEIG
jgi:drug/metabolite transporter (DMT)-like permease